VPRPRPRSGAMRISGGAVPAREMEERMFEWIAASATYQTGGSAGLEPFGDHTRALEAGPERSLSTASPVEEEIVGTVRRFVGR
jgi:hypothetical protein